jgi:hypothetical protein
MSNLGGFDESGVQEDSDIERLASESRANEQMRLIRERNQATISQMELESEDEEKVYRDSDYPDIPDEEAESLKNKCNNDSEFMGENLTYKSGVQAVLNITRDDKYVAYCYNYGELIKTMEGSDYQVVVWSPNERGYYSPDTNLPVYKEPYLGFWIDKEGYENAKIYNTLVLVSLRKERLGTSAPRDGSVPFASRMHGEPSDTHMIYTLKPVHFHTFHNREKITREDIDNFQAEKRDLLPVLADEEDFRLVSADPMAIREIENPSTRVQLKAVRRDGYAIEFIEDPSEIVQLEAVMRHGGAIQFINDPSETVQLEAVRRNGYVIQHIKNPSERVRLEAVRQNGRAIRYIKNPSEEVQIAAILNTRNAIMFIENPTPRVEATMRG